jgi:urease accessory protein
VPLLVRRIGTDAPPAVAATALMLPLTADQRTSLRGRRRSACGRELLLHLPRGAPLEPGEWLQGPNEAPLVRVEAAPEPLLRVRAATPLGLLQAAYHLGNRHVALQVLETELRLLADPVLEDLLRQRGMRLDHLEAPFLPEAGAYAAGWHRHHG